MTETPMAETATLTTLKQMTAQDFALFGVQQVAYVKPILVEGVQGWAIHAADGNTLGMAPDRATAFAAVVQNELEPMSVH